LIYFLLVRLIAVKTSLLWGYNSIFCHIYTDNRFVAKIAGHMVYFIYLRKEMDNMLNISQYEDKIRKICVDLNLKKLDIFGSAMTGEFGPGSDIDIIVEFDNDKNENLFEKYFLLKEALGSMFHRPIDVVVEGSIKNPFLKQTISSTRKNIYAA